MPIQGLFDDLVAAKQREVAGSRTSRSFDYQRDWALSWLLRDHSKGKDYAFAFEFHDDVVHFNSATNPSEIDFCQVKTKRSGHWSPAALVAKQVTSGKKKDSIIEKLYDNYQRFKSYDVQLFFVSNQQFDFFQETGKFKAEDLKVRAKKTIVDCLKAKFPAFDGKDLQRLSFEVSHLPADKQDPTLLGEIVTYFTDRFGDSGASFAKTWQSTIRDEIRRKNNYPSDKITSTAALISMKCVCRDDVEKVFLEVASKIKTKPDWDIVQNYLVRDKFDAGDVGRMRDGWNQFSIEKLDKTNDLLDNLTKSVEQVVKGAMRCSSTKDFVSAAIADLKSSHKKSISSFDETFIAAVCLWVGYEERKF